MYDHYCTRMFWIWLYSFFLVSFILYMLLCCSVASFCFNLKNFFSVSCKEDLVMTNTFVFYLSGEVFMSPSFLKDSFHECSILFGSFSFSTLNMSPTLSYFASSAEKSIDSLGQFQCIWQVTLLVLAFKILCLWLLRNWL